MTPAQTAEAASTELAGRIVSILLDAGFPSLLIERGQVVLSGFVVTIEVGGEVDGRLWIRWRGTHAVNAQPFRRTFLGAYASHLRQSGLAVTYVEGDGEGYLACQSGPPQA